MNKKLGMAVAGAVMAFGASAANAGITIPAGDWTIDIGGNVNSYYTNTDYDWKSGAASAPVGSNQPKDDDANNVSTGLLPSALGIGGKTRQNDLDIAFQFTFFVGGSSSSSGGGDFGDSGANLNSLNIRQAYMTFGDASWGSIKMGRDLGIFGSDAILSDMTLLGVGGGAGGAGSSTLGRIGSGYIYADWVGQIAYTSPNWNGFSFAAAVREPWGSSDNNDLGFDAKASYEWTGDMAGKVWVGGIRQKTAALDGSDNTASAWELGGKVSLAGFGLVGYIYDGKNFGVNNYLAGANEGWPGTGLTINNNGGQDRDVDGGYIQGTYTLPGVGTKLGLSFGKSEVESLGGASDHENESWIVGAYHPLTKSLNLVAEYTKGELTNLGDIDNNDVDVDTIALGAILFF